MHKICQNFICPLISLDGGRVSPLTNRAKPGTTVSHVQGMLQQLWYGLRTPVCDGGGMLIYHRPLNLREALSVARGSSGEACFFAGGTDLLPRWSKGLLEIPQALVDLKTTAELRGVTRDNGEIRLGACTSMSEIEADPLIQSAAPVLAHAAGRIACPQIRNRATIGGNLCNASPAADTAIPLLLLDAVVDLASSRSNGATVRKVPIADFFLGPGDTVLAPGEILTRIHFTPPSDGTLAAWDKFGTRPSMEIAVASVGLAIRVETGTVTHARVAYGSVAPVPLRGRQAEAELVGRPLSAAVIDECKAAARAEIMPIGDLRASEAYRREIVGIMLERMLERARRT